MSATRFSVIITSYNQREFITDAVDSALALPQASREIIVVDDESTDGSQEVLRAYADRVRLVCLESNHGKGAARNRGASLASADYLVFLDGDDTLLPWALHVYERVVQAKAPKLILGRMSWFRGAVPIASEKDTPRAIQIVEYDDYLKKDRPFSVSASSLVVDRQSFQSVQGWAHDRSVMQDQDLVIRLSDSRKAVQILSPPTILHRGHAGQTVNNVPPYIDVMYQMIHKNRLGAYPGGRRRRFERSALLGGLAFHWAKRALRAKLYWKSFELVARGWPMIGAATLRRAASYIKGRRPCETLEM